MNKRPSMRVLNAIAESSWSILPETLDKIIEIASREHEIDVDALAAKMGQRMDKTYDAQVREGGVGVLNVEGPLFRYANIFSMFSGGSSFDMLALDFNKLVNSEDVHAIVLNINSPGGQTDGTSEFASMVKEARGKKPIVAYVSHTGASAAYWIASAADSIVVEQAAAVGSIGTVARVRTEKEKGVREIVSSQSPKKRPDASTDDGVKQIQEHVDALSDVFIKTVADNRGVKVEKVLKEFGQGGMLVGESAVAVGMADSVGTLEGVIASLSGKHKQRKEVRKMDELKNATREILAQHNPNLVQAITVEGATAERKRIQEVLAQSLPGHEALVNALAFDGKTTAAEAALQILSAEKKVRGERKEKIYRESPDPAPTPEPTPNKPPKASSKIEAGMSREEVKSALKPEWEANEELREEFMGDFDGYCIYKEQEAKGNVRFFGDKKTAGAK